MSFPQPSVNVIYFGELRKVESVNVRFIESLVKQKKSNCQKNEQAHTHTKPKTEYIIHTAGSCFYK